MTCPTHKFTWEICAMTLHTLYMIITSHFGQTTELDRLSALDYRKSTSAENILSYLVRVLANKDPVRAMLRANILWFTLYYRNTFLSPSLYPEQRKFSISYFISTKIQIFACTIYLFCVLRNRRRSSSVDNPGVIVKYNQSGSENEFHRFTNSEFLGCDRLEKHYHVQLEVGPVRTTGEREVLLYRKLLPM